MATLPEELLKYQSMMDQFNQLTGRINRQKDAEAAFTPKLDTEERVLENIIKSREGRIAEDLPTPGQALGTMQGPTVPESPSPEELKRQFRVNKNMGQMVGEGAEPSKPLTRTEIDEFKARVRGVKPPTDAISDPGLVDEMTPSGLPRQRISDNPVMSAAEDIDEANLLSENKQTLSEMKQAAKDARVNTIKSNLAQMKKTPDVSSKLAQTETQKVIEKLHELPEEQLSKLGRIGELIKNSKAATLASKAANSGLGKFTGQVGIPLVGTAFEAANAKEALDKGDYTGALASSAGAGSGIATLAGSSAALPLGLAAGSYHAGKTISDVMGGEPPQYAPRDPNEPISTPTVIAPGQPGSTGIFGPTQGMGPFADASKYNPSVAAQPEAASRTVSSEEPSSKNPEQEALQNLLQQDQGFTNNTVAALKEAQDKQLAAQKDARLTNMMNAIGSSIAGLGSNSIIKNTMEDYYKERAKDETITKHFQEQVEKEKDDRNSQSSKQAVNFASEILRKAGFDPKLVSGMSYNEIQKNFPQITSIMNQAESRKTREAIAKENRLSREEARADKLTEKRKLSDKQVEGINEFDDTVNKVNDALAKLGDKKGWVGPIDGRIPDIVTGAEEVAFRAAIGRMSDAYRKLITGTGASNQELARLEGRLPKETDSFPQFKEKASELIRETKKAKETHLHNYEKQGKDVSAFKIPSSSVIEELNNDIQEFAEKHTAGDYKKAEALLRQMGEI